MEDKHTHSFEQDFIEGGEAICECGEIMPE